MGRENHRLSDVVNLCILGKPGRHQHRDNHQQKDGKHSKDESVAEGPPELIIPDQDHIKVPQFHKLGAFDIHQIQLEERAHDHEDERHQCKEDGVEGCRKHIDVHRIDYTEHFASGLVEPL